MKRLIVLLLMLILILPSEGAFFHRKDKNLEIENQGKGYAGTLPSLESTFQKKQNKSATPIFESQKGFNNPKDLKPAPTEDPAFVDIITKKDKTSEYVKDVSELIPIMEKLADCIEDNGNVQLFVTRANVFSMNVDHLITKYDGQPESCYESFKKLTDVNRYAKSVAELRKEAMVYQRYLAYQAEGSIYNPENINQQLEYLLEELNTAIVMLREDG